MTTATIDTHRAAKRLQQQGFSEAQAEGVIDLALELRAGEVSNLARKQDVADVRHEIELLKRDLTIRTGGMLVVAVGAIPTLVKLL